MHKLKQKIVIISLLTFSISAFSNEEKLSVMKLKQCPDSPNCVSSQSTSASHKINPLPYSSSPEEATQQIKKIILALSGTKLIEEKDQYLHFEFRSLVFRFIDDVEIVIDDSEKVIHLRSASRVGYSDFGANRRRIEKIKNKFR